MPSPDAIRSVLKFLESQESKMKEYMSTGDIAETPKNYREKSEVRQRYLQAKKLVSEGMSRTAACKKVEISRSTYNRHSKNV